jgi:hypothetical protein
MHDIAIVPPGRNDNRVAYIPTDESVGYCQIVPDGTDTSNDVTPSLAACAMIRNNSFLSIMGVFSDLSAHLLYKICDGEDLNAMKRM